MNDSEPSAESWQRLEELFHEALELEGEAREAFLDRRCAGDPELRREVESLLAFSSQERTRVEQAVSGAIEVTVDELDGFRPDDRVGPYRIERILGRGGLSTVYLAERADEQYRMRVALKVVRRGMARGEILDRMRQERQILASLDHPNIARLLDGGTTRDGLPYFVMEYIEGEDLETWCDSQRLTVRQRLLLFRQVCAAVDYAHRSLVVHRDIKPGNILVTEQGVPKLLDFGIAKVLTGDGGAAPSPELLTAPTVTGQLLLTPPFASPEQVRGEPLTTATDVYSLGVVLYRLLTGRHPYELAGLRPAELERILCTAEPERPSQVVRGLVEPGSGGLAPQRIGAEEIARRRGAGGTEALGRQLSGDLDTIVLKALRKEPVRRYASPSQLADDLRRHLDGLPVSARPDTLTYRSRKFLRRHRLAVTTAATVGLLLTALVAFYTLRLSRERDRARLEASKATQVIQLLIEAVEVADPDRSKGETVTVRELMDSAAARVPEELAQQPEVEATMMRVIGIVYRKLGLYGEARRMLEQALDIRRQLLGPDAPEVAASLDDLSELMLEIGEYERGEQLSREALDIHRRRLGEDAPATLTSLNNLAVFHYVRGDLETAEELARLALERRRRVLGLLHQDVATSLNNLASIVEVRGETAEAERLYREALDLKRSLFGDDHTDVAAALDNLAGFLESQGEDREAEQLYRQSLAIYRRLVGESYQDVTHGLESLARLAARRGAAREAVQLLREALDTQRQRPAPDQAWMAALLLQLGEVLAGDGRPAEAARALRESIELGRQAYGPEHPGRWRLGQAQSLLGACLAALGEPAEARPLLAAGHALLAEELGPEDPRTLKALSRLTGDGPQPPPPLPPPG